MRICPICRKSSPVGPAEFPKVTDRVRYRCHTCGEYVISGSLLEYLMSDQMSPEHEALLPALGRAVRFYSDENRVLEIYTDNWQKIAGTHSGREAS